MSTEKIGFRTRLFGGFDRSDVAASIERISAERNLYKKRVEELEAQIDALTDEVTHVREDATLAIQAATEASDRARNAYADAIEKAKETLHQFNAQYSNMRTDLSAAINATQAQIDMVHNQLDAFLATVNRTGDVLHTLVTQTGLDSTSWSGSESNGSDEKENDSISSHHAEDTNALNAEAMTEAVKDALNDLGLDLQDLQNEQSAADVPSSPSAK